MYNLKSLSKTKTAIQGNPEPIIQTKLKVGQVGDKYEREADAVANRVMSMPQSNQIIQMACSGCDEELHMKTFQNQDVQMQPIEEEEEFLQPKLRLQPLEEEEEMLQTKRIQKQACESCGEKEMRLQNSQQSMQISPFSHIESCGGTALPDSTKGFFEARMGYNFDNVKVHTCDSAVQMNQQLGAQAFTYGNNIFFNKGKYSPGQREGNKLLAHELAHVVQQTSTIQPTMIQCEAAETEVDTTRCINPQPITNDVRRFRNQVIRQISRNPSLQDIEIPEVPPPTHEETLARIRGTRPVSLLSLRAYADRAFAALNVLSDESGFSFATAEFYACDTINLSELQIQPGQQVEGFVDPDITPARVYYLISFANSLQQYLTQNDQDALQEVLELIAHEKRHVTLSGNVPTVEDQDLLPGADTDSNNVNYLIEEILTTAEEIWFNTRFNNQYELYEPLRYSIPGRIYGYWNRIKELVNPTQHETIRTQIQAILRTRYGSSTCDNAISTGVLTAMMRGDWYRCRGSEVQVLPDEITPCEESDICSSGSLAWPSLEPSDW